MNFKKYISRNTFWGGKMWLLWNSLTEACRGDEMTILKTRRSIMKTLLALFSLFAVALVRIVSGYLQMTSSPKGERRGGIIRTMIPLPQLISDLQILWVWWKAVVCLMYCWSGTRSRRLLERWLRPKSKLCQGKANYWAEGQGWYLLHHKAAANWLTRLLHFFWRELGICENVSIWVGTPS